MSDENMNGFDNETDALFVSAQKKKQAEDESKRKAAEEQAKREAAEAEIRRMEAEVEERRKRAEEEKKALEESEKAAKAAPAKKNEEKAEPVKKESGKPGIPKMAFIIGGALIAVIAIVLIIVLGSKGKKAVNTEEVAFDGEYVTTASNVKLTLKYPKSVFTGEVTEKSEDGRSTISLGESKVADANFIIAYSDVKKGTENALYQLAKRSKEMPDVGKTLVEALDGGKIIEESIPDDAQNPKDPAYKCKFTSDTTSGQLASWFVYDENDELCMVTAIVTEKAKEPDNSVKLCDKFIENNTERAALGIGANPPASEDMDGMIRLEEAHLGIPVPSKTFEQVEDGTWVDNNGAVITVGLQETDLTEDIIDENKAEFQETLKEMVDEIVAAGDEHFQDVQLSTGRIIPQYYCGYEADVTSKLEGVIPYRIKFELSFWRDVKTEKWYILTFEVCYPTKNSDVYEPMIQKALGNKIDL